MRILPLLLAIPLLSAAPLRAQDDTGGADNTIHAVTTLLDDGSRTVTVTDPDKHSSEADTYNAANKLIQKIVYNLDQNNQPVSSIVFGRDGVTPVFKAAYKHDDNNRVSEEDDYTLDDQLIRRFTYEFGPDGKVTRVHAFDSQGNELQPADGARRDERRSAPRVH